MSDETNENGGVPQDLVDMITSLGESFDMNENRPLSDNERVMPKTWDDFQGQTKLKRRLGVSVKAALADDRPFPHTLLLARPGQGKTTMANILATELGVDLVVGVAPVTVGWLANTMRERAGQRFIMFIDELHRNGKKDHENLLTLLEEGYVFHEGERLYHHDLTIIGATTDGDKIPQALMDRWALRPQFSPYSPEDLLVIVSNMLTRLSVENVDESTAGALAAATLGTPRNARRLAIAARDLQSIGEEVTAEAVFDQTGVEADGLDENHFSFLTTLENLGGRAGLDPIAQQMRISRAYAGEIEVPLVGLNYLTLETNGRTLTEKGTERIKKWREG